MAKGAGMLAPGLATMLVVITTDAVLDAPQADAALRAATRTSFDRLDSDGCMSTNDQVTLLASGGASGVAPSLDDFTAALTEVTLDLARQLQSDAEGASKDIAIEVDQRGHRRRRRRGRSLGRPQQPVQVGDVRQRSELGPGARRNRHDERAVRPLRGRRLDERGAGVLGNGAPDRPRDEVDLTPRAVQVLIDLKAGGASAHHLDQRPYARLRARELGVRLA